jgi:hypothetical protein
MGAVMLDPDHIRGKLTTLLNKQIDVLEQETFGGVTEADYANTMIDTIESASCTPN